MSSNRTLGAVALLVAAILVVFGWGLVAPFSYEPVGPRAFPLLTAALIAFCGVVLMIRGGNDADPVNGRTMTGIAMLVATLLVYAVVFERLGYVPSTLLMAAVVARIFGATVVQAAASGAVLSVGSYLLFDRGLATVEAANNSASNSNFIPMLTLGIPSSGTTAIMLRVLTLYDLTPGPMLFTSQPELVWGLIASLFIGNVTLLAMNIPLVGLFARMLSVPAWVLVPFIVVVSAVGVYSGKSASFDLILMVGVGAVAYWLRRMQVPMAPLRLRCRAWPCWPT